jgi:hypothetical protein
VARNDVMIQHLLLHGLVLQKETCTAHRTLHEYAAACSMRVCCADCYLACLQFACKLCEREPAAQLLQLITAAAATAAARIPGLPRNRHCHCQRCCNLSVGEASPTYDPKPVMVR